jgi:hypothetical protein
MVKLLPLQLQTMVDFAFVGKKQAVSSFAQKKIVICIREPFRASGSIHPVCPTHQKFAKLCMVKDTKKDNYGRPFFVCSERNNPCKFWQWGDVFEGRKPLCQHGMVCCEPKSQERWSKSKPSVLLLSEGRLLRFLRMEATRTSCNQHWHRALQ